MGKHNTHIMHENSLLAYELEKRRLAGRKAEIYKYCWGKAPMTDRQIKQGMGFEDMNSVRPRITDLIQSGDLVEVMTKTDPSTNKTVRMVSVNITEPQQRV